MVRMREEGVPGEGAFITPSKFRGKLFFGQDVFHFSGKEYWRPAVNSAHQDF